MFAKRFVPCASALVFVFAWAYAPCASFAQMYDHLACYKVRDPEHFAADVDLVGTLFGSASNCKLKIKAKQYCVAVTKTVNSTDAPSLLFASPAHQRELLCYKVKCTGQDTDPLEVSDQFGTRTIERSRVATLCTPAVVGPPPMYCGDGLVNQPSEQCDGQPNSCPSMNCLDDCTCGPPLCCEIGCAYIPEAGPGHGYDCPASKIDCSTCQRSGECCDGGAMGCIQSTPDQDYCDVFALPVIPCSACTNCCDMGGYCMNASAGDCAALGGASVDCASCWQP